MPSTLRVVSRFLWYAFSRIFVWAIAAALVVLAFYSAMDYMNAQTLVKDGMQLRAEVIIKGDDPTSLTKVFSKGFLEQDTQLSSGLYRSFTISNIDYSAEVGFSLVMPWQNSIELRVKETISGIQGDLLTSAESNDTLSQTPPLWQNAIYNVKLTRYEGNWRIVGMDLIESLPTPTPTPAASPSPQTSATPSATQTESAEPTEGDIIED